MFALSISIVTFIYLLVTSLVVLIKNNKNLVNISLGVSLIAFAFWTMGVAGLTTSFVQSQMYGRLVFAAAGIGLHSLYLFAYFITPSLKTTVKRVLTPILSSSVMVGVIAIALTPLVLRGVTPAVEGNLPEPVYGPLYLAFIFWAVTVGVATAVLLIKNYHYSHGIRRLQAQVILYGVILTVIIGLSTNAIIPIILGNSSSANLTPLSMIILSASLSYAVLRHRFLDIRLVIARSVGYVLALLVLISSYALISYVIAGKIFTNFTGEAAQRALNIGLMIFVALTFNPIKRFFDRLTNKFFYQDAYSPQELFNSFNEALVANAELSKLLAASTEVVAQNLKADFCRVALNGRDLYHPRVVGTNDATYASEDIRKGHKLLKDVQTKIIVTDYLEENDPLKIFLLKDGIAVMAHLRDGDDLGYLILGTKRSGNPYNEQDVRIIETLTDELVIAIQNSLRFEKIERFNETLQEKIEDATRKLRRTNEKLRMLDQTKDDFISMASHQLRTPLTSVKGYVSMVLDGDAGKVTPLQRKLLNQSFISSQRMVYLISDLLNVSRLRTGKFIIEPVPSNLGRVIRDEVEQLQETAKGRNLELSFNKPEHFPTLMLDETKMRQVIMNFIDNAIYYTPSGGHISINLVDKPASIEFTVVDDGMGVPRSEQHHLFTKFFRANNAKRARPDGTGLGLFMAKKVIVAQGGAIIFRSQEGKGSTFGFTFNKDKLEGKAIRPEM
ncbi:MAG: ATP-binding protein [Candidatus Saccharimonadales bacterium]